MLKFIGKRLLQLIPTLIAISLLIFIVVDFMPGDYVQSYLGLGSDVTPERQQEIRELLGLDRSMPIRYLSWLGRIVTGDLGRSLVYSDEVSNIIFGFIWNSFLLNFFFVNYCIVYCDPCGDQISGEEIRSL